MIPRAAALRGDPTLAPVAPLPPPGPDRPDQSTSSTPASLQIPQSEVCSFQLPKMSSFRLPLTAGELGFASRRVAGSGGRGPAFPNVLPNWSSCGDPAAPLPTSTTTKVSPQPIRPSTLAFILSVKAKRESELKFRDRS